MLDVGIEWSRSRGEGGRGGVSRTTDMEGGATEECGGAKHIISHRRRRTARVGAPAAVYALLASSTPFAMAQNCISLATSTQCPAFSAASISTDSALVGIFPFLSSVTDTASFDSGLKAYINNGFAQERYVLHV